MHIKLPIAFFAAAFMAATLSGTVMVQSAFSPQTAAAGQSVSYTVSITGTSTESMDGRPPEVPGLVIGSGVSTSRQVNIVNGRVNSSISYSWQASASTEGTYTVPAYDVNIGGTTCTVPAATLTVTKPGAEATGAIAVEVTAPKAMYPGQAAAGSLKILTRNDLRRAGGLSPKPTADGLIVDPLNPQLAALGSESRSGVSCDSLSVPIRITAVKPGAQSLSFDVSGQFAFPDRRRSNNGMDDDFQRMMRMPLFDEVTGDIRTLSARGSANIEVRPLPAGMPDSFAGAVGSFTMSAVLSTTEGKAGEPVEVAVAISGTGDLKQMEAPVFTPSPQWKSYPPTSEVRSDDPLELSGTKTFKFLITPLAPGNLALPELRFAYLDPASGKYVELKAAPGRVAVTGDPIAPQPPAPGRDVAGDARTAAPVGAFHPIELLDTGAIPSALVPPQKNLLFLLAQLLPAALFGWAVAVPLLRRRRERDPLGAQRRSHAKRARSARRRALAAAAKGDDTAFFRSAQESLRLAVCALEPERRPETVSAADVTRALGENGESLRREAGLIFSGEEAFKYGGPRVPCGELAPALDAILGKLGVK
ncbi:MAG TPA: BatD family protein [Opitutales bacterium]|nr:BatD family protein [Opitutales bacterium]